MLAKSRLMGYHGRTVVAMALTAGMPRYVAKCAGGVLRSFVNLGSR